MNVLIALMRKLEGSYLEVYLNTASNLDQFLKLLEEETAYKDVLAMMGNTESAQEVYGRTLELIDAGGDNGTLHQHDVPIAIYMALLAQSGLKRKFGYIVNYVINPENSGQFRWAWMIANIHVVGE